MRPRNSLIDSKALKKRRLNDSKRRNLPSLNSNSKPRRLKNSWIKNSPAK